MPILSGVATVPFPTTKGDPEPGLVKGPVTVPVRVRPVRLL